MLLVFSECNIKKNKKLEASLESRKQQTKSSYLQVGVIGFMIYL